MAQDLYFCIQDECKQHCQIIENLSEFEQHLNCQPPPISLKKLQEELKNPNSASYSTFKSDKYKNKLQFLDQQESNMIILIRGYFQEIKNELKDMFATYRKLRNVYQAIINDDIKQMKDNMNCEDIRSVRKGYQTDEINIFTNDVQSQVLKLTQQFERISKDKSIGQVIQNQAVPLEILPQDQSKLNIIPSKYINSSQKVGFTVSKLENYNNQKNKLGIVSENPFDIEKITLDDEFQITSDQYIYSCVFSPDGRIFATGHCTFEDASYHGTCCINLWNADQGDHLTKINAHQGSINTLCFTKDGNTLISCSNDKLIKIWDVATGNEIGRLYGHKESVYDVALSPNQKIIASVSFDITVRIWDFETKSELFTLKGHTGQVKGVAFSPSGQQLATCGGDNSVIIWDLDRKKMVEKPLIGHKNIVQRVSYSKDGTKILSCGWDKILILWSAEKRSIIGKLKGHNGVIEQGFFAMDDRIIISSSNDFSIRIWDVNQLSQIGQSYICHNSAIWGLSLSQDEQKLVSGSHGDKKIVIWGVKGFNKYQIQYMIDQNGFDSNDKQQQFTINQNDKIEMKYNQNQTLEISNLNTAEKVTTVIKEFSKNKLQFASLGGLSTQIFEKN